MNKGLRHNEGKLRLDLMPTKAFEEYAKVLTVGAQKYAPRNWEKGMEWSSVMASLKRHVLAWERGEDIDTESGLLHMAHVMCNASFLVDYYHSKREWDDRNLYRGNRIGLDVDELLADFIGDYCVRYGMKRPRSWRFDFKFGDRYARLLGDKDFWMNIPRLCNSDEWSFEPVAYVTARKIPTEWTEEWLFNQGFPCAPVINESDKKEAVIEHNIDLFVDDSWDNYFKINEVATCLLIDRPHNARYNAGLRRIESLNQINV